MKILISTLDSRGDTQPCLALAVGLKEGDHQVTLAVPRSFSEWIQSLGVNAHPVRFNPQEVMRSITKSSNPLQAIRFHAQGDENGCNRSTSPPKYYRKLFGPP